MNKIGALNFGKQVVPVASEKPITPQEKAELAEMKKLLDEKVGKDVVDFQVKDDKNFDIVVNHQNPKIEKEIADRLREMASGIHPQQAKAPQTPAPKTAPKPAAAGQSLDVVA